MRHLRPCLSPYRYLHLYRYQVLIGNREPEQGVGQQLNCRNIKMPLRPRRIGRDTKDCA
jgi:hypothetical protein